MVSQIAANTCRVMRNCLGHCTCLTSSGSAAILPRPFSELLLECTIRYLLLHGRLRLCSLFIRYPITRINVVIVALDPFCGGLFCLSDRVERLIPGHVPAAIPILGAVCLRCSVTLWPVVRLSSDIRADAPVKLALKRKAIIAPIARSQSCHCMVFLLVCFRQEAGEKRCAPPDSASWACLTCLKNCLTLGVHP